jgi:hypothetical protein
MADNLSEFKGAILRTIRREVASIDSQRAIELSMQTHSPLNALGGSVDEGFDETIATGYDAGTGATTVAFTWDMSVWGSADVWTGS